MGSAQEVHLWTSVRSRTLGVVRLSVYQTGWDESGATECHPEADVPVGRVGCGLRGDCIFETNRTCLRIVGSGPVGSSGTSTTVDRHTCEDLQEWTG